MGFERRPLCQFTARQQMALIAGHYGKEQACYKQCYRAVGKFRELCVFQMTEFCFCFASLFIRFHFVFQRQFYIFTTNLIFFFSAFQIYTVFPTHFILFVLEELVISKMIDFSSWSFVPFRGIYIYNVYFLSLYFSLLNHMIFPTKKAVPELRNQPKNPPNFKSQPTIRHLAISLAGHPPPLSTDRYKRKQHPFQQTIFP